MGALSRYRKQGGGGSANGITMPQAPPTGSLASSEDLGREAANVGGFFENLIGDFKELGQGIGHLGGAAVNDLVGSIQTVVPGGTSDANFLLDDLVKQVGYNWEGKSPGDVLKDLGTIAATGGLAAAVNPDVGRAIKDDYSQRYGALLPGGRPAGDIGHDLYEDPLSYLLDVADVATLGGTAATKGAQMASRAGKPIARELAELGVDAGADVSRSARLVDAIIPGRKAQLAGNADMPLAGTRQRVTQRGETLDIENSLNPIRRATIDKATERLVTKPIDRVVREKVPAGAVEYQDVAQLKRSIDAADEAGLSRLERKAISNARAGGMAKQIIARMSGRMVVSRNEAMEELAGILKGLPEEEADSFHLKLQGVQTHPSQAGRLSFDEIAEVVTNPQTQRERMVAEAVADDIERIAQITDPVEAQAARRYIEKVAGEPLAAERAGVVDDVADIMDDIELWAHRRMTKPKLEKGLPYTNVLDRAYQPMRQVAGARFDKELGRFVGDGLDPDQAAFMYDDAVVKTGNKGPVYFPHEEPLLARRSDFLTTQRMSGMRKAAKDPGEKRNTGVLFQRHIEGQPHAYITDPMEAYSRRASQAIRQQEVGEGIKELVTSLGRRVHAKDQVASGERVINLDAVEQRVRSRLAAREEVEDAISQGGDLDEAAFGAAKKAVITDPAEIARAFDANASLYAVPAAAARKIEQYQLGRLGHGDQYVRLFFDTPMNAWRAGALYLSPRFYLNNILGNTTFLKLQGGKLAGVLKQANPKYREALRKAIGDEALRDIEKAGFFSKVSQRATHNPGFGGETTRRVNQSAPGRATGFVFERLRRFNEAIENSYRRESYVTGVEHANAKMGLKRAGNSWFKSYKRLDQVAEAGADPNSMRRALDEMNQTMNDYSALGPLERNFIRRFIFPFWGFYKHSAKTLISMPWKHPLKATLLDKIAEVDEEMKSEYGPVPEFLEGYLPIGENEEGETTFLSTRGPNPFSGVMENPLSMMSPALQVGYEQLTGRDSFTGKKFTAPDVVTPYGTDKQFKAVRDANGNIIGVEEVKLTPGFGETLLGQLPLANQIRDITTGGARYTAGGGVIPDETGEPMYPTELGQELGQWLGVSTLDYDINEYQQQQQGDEMEALKLLLQRLGGQP